MSTKASKTKQTKTTDELLHEAMKQPGLAEAMEVFACASKYTEAFSLFNRSAVAEYSPGYSVAVGSSAGC